MAKGDAGSEETFDLPELELGPSVRELPASEPAELRLDAIELAVLPARRASTQPPARPVIPLTQAAHDLSRLDGRALDLERACVRHLELAAAPRPASHRPTSPRLPHVPLASIERRGDHAAIARAPSEFESTFQFDTPLVNGAALPVALAVALLVHAMGMGTTVFMTVGMWTHELGHAIAAWLSGFFAIPLPFVTIRTSDDRNILVMIVVAGSWIALGVFGYLQKNRALIIGATAVAILQIWMTLVMSPGRSQQWVLFAGMGGEILLSTVMMLAFYQRFPWRWDFWRYLVLLTCSISYVHALLRWIGVALGIAEMPHGAANGDNAEGDVERLVRTHEFTIPALARTYLFVALACGGVLAFAYLYYLRRARNNARLANAPT